MAVLLSAISVLADGTNKTAVEQVKAGVLEVTGETNLQAIVVDILRGAKNASGEIYQASKTAIGKSVDFAVEQSPLVVKEFLRWRMAKSIIHIASAIIACGLILWYVQRLINSSAKDSDWDGMAIGWAFKIMTMTVLILVLTANAMTITKICIAPRVYLIEYVVSQIHGK